MPLIMEDSPLSRLPTELRNEIYHLALIEENPVLINSDTRRVWRAPALLQTCRQLRAEASPVFLGNNAFLSARYFYHIPVSLHSWCRMIG